MPRIGRIETAAVAVILGLAVLSPVAAQAPSTIRPIRPLMPGDLPPAPSDQALNAIVQDKTVLLALGKALFWDVQVGGPNGLACASCHYHAGVDTRTVNQTSPGLKVLPTPDKQFGAASPTPPYRLMGRSTVAGPPAVAAGPNVQLVPDDFPFRKLTDVHNRESAVLYDSNDVVSSNGAFQGGPVADEEADPVGQRARCSSTPSDIFFINRHGTPLNTRKVERRNTSPSVNTAFNYRNLWDGRAGNVFNGIDPFGFSAAADPAARVWVSDGASVKPMLLQLENMSAASQAVGPVLNSFEMTCERKVFADIGRRLMQQRALSGQAVAPDDSVFSSTPGIAIMPASAGGIGANYRQLIRAAFQPAFWQDNHFYTVDRASGSISQGGGASGGHQIDELNFSMFFGIAVDAYERSLVSDKSLFDTAPQSLTDEARAGRAIFEGKGKCAGCHDGPLFSRAMTYQGDAGFRPLDRASLDGQAPALHDTGFYNIGVRPSYEDIGIGGVDPRGKPFSFTRQFVLAPERPELRTDRFTVDACQFQVPFSGAGGGCLTSAASAQSQRVAVDGAFKVPTLRNVALTAPYFHNGGQKSLAEVLAFYNRGGDRRAVYGGDTTGTGPLGRPVMADARVTSAPAMGGSNAAAIAPLGLTDREQAQVVAFLKALTDPRVACHTAPFDHPALAIPNGHLPQDTDRDGNADDKVLTMRAVGTKGYAGCGGSMFEQLNSGELFSSSAAFEGMSTK